LALQKEKPNIPKTNQAEKEKKANCCGGVRRYGGWICEASARRRVFLISDSCRDDALDGGDFDDLQIRLIKVDYTTNLMCQKFSVKATNINFEAF
jgi:hypothetical protein